jgi:two-component system, sensor histidine kinase RpfC
MAACLVKPVEPAHLLAMIEELLQGTHTQEAPAERIISHPRVTKIAAHPRFRSNLNLPPAADTEILERLRKLGGDAFLAEVCELFRSEAQARIQELHAAARLMDVPSFRANAHALRSVSANIGAQHLYEICQPVQHISATALREDAQSWLEQVGAELKRVDLALSDYCAGRGVQSGH